MSNIPKKLETEMCVVKGTLHYHVPRTNTPRWYLDNGYTVCEYWCREGNKDLSGSGDPSSFGCGLVDSSMSLADQWRGKKFTVTDRETLGGDWGPTTGWKVRLEKEGFKPEMTVAEWVRVATTKELERSAPLVEWISRRGEESVRAESSGF